MCTAVCSVWAASVEAQFLREACPVLSAAVVLCGTGPQAEQKRLALHDVLDRLLQVI